jgi:hypothetical protein
MHRRNDAFDAAAFGPASIQTDKPANELGRAFIRFSFATFRRSSSTRLWLQYSIFCDVLQASRIHVIARSIPGVNAEAFRAGLVKDSTIS